MNNTFKTPILFIIFNRPETTTRVFEEIRKIKPEKLYIAADGPRENKPEENKICNEVRKIATRIDWECEVKTLFQKKNLGCKVGVSTAINWFFDNVEQGIILEDDCLPNESFFIFCETMLERYKNEDKIMHISGTNFQFGNTRGEASYYFSQCTNIWGWATWKRAWNKYNSEMDSLEEYIKSKKIFNLFKDRKVAKFWLSLFSHIIKKNIDTWDAQWAYAVIKSEGIAISPNTNLIENIGFGNGTHTNNKINSILRQKSKNIGEIVFTINIEVDKNADNYLVKKLYLRPLFQRIMDKIPFLR